jgi:hypothetical protein
MNWLREAINDSKTGLASTKRINVLMAGATLSICTLILTAIVYWRVEVVPALIVFGGSLSAMAGAGYVMGKGQEQKRDAQ